MALSAVQSDCDAGYYCSAGSYMRSPLVSLYTSVTDNIGDICPQGSYCSSGVSTPTLCSGGFFCPDLFMSALVSTNVCQQGYYCSGGAQNPSPNGPFSTLMSQSTQSGGNVCPMGSYCGAGSSTYVECSAGQYLPYQGAYAETECISCTQGQYCATDGLGAQSGSCTAGYFCAQGSQSATAVRCADDMYCPTGTYSMISCPDGQYTQSTGSATCLTCPAGSTCRGTSTTNDCPNGYYCTGDRKFPCPQGTWMESLTGQSVVGSCAACTAGYACKSLNTQLDCSSGFYCTGSTYTPKPNNQNGGMCTPGYYCPSASSSQTACPTGYYCPNYGSNTYIACPAGYYCPNTGAQDSSDSTKYRICPSGYYCPIGTVTPIACDAGYYSKSQGATQSSDCDKCPAGSYCPAGTSVPYTDTTGLSSCAAGYYCSAGSTASTQTLCSRGYYCPPGTPAQIWCPKGTYQDTTGQTSCKQCPAGYYCDSTDPTTYATCPQGYYCLAGTQYANQYPCPAGTYGSTSRLTTSTQCTSCTNGYYCQFKGQSAMSTKTLARYHNNNENGKTLPDSYLCPYTMYCTIGTQLAISCPNGYWTNWYGASSPNDCITCPRGKWCNFYDMSQYAPFKAWMAGGYGTWSLDDLEAIENNSLHPYYSYHFLTHYFGDCDPGYICLEGATTPTPSSIAANRGYPCPIGYYCPLGATIEIPCAPGTYNDETLLFACKACPAGNYCPDFGMTTYTTCLEGYYCDGSNIYPKPCPAGTYGSPSGSSSSGDCLACPATQYCDVVGQMSPADYCSAGFICVSGADRPGPYVTVYPATTSPKNNGQCPIGYFCAQGDSVPTVCPSTSYQPTTQSFKCEYCPPGSYCTGGSNIQDCQAGYFCSKKSLTSAPTLAQSEMGGICPIQHYCPAGTSQPLTCQDGFIQRKIGKSSCSACPSGYTCKAGVQSKCPMYKVCNTTESEIYPYARSCPSGFYLTSTQSGVGSYSNCTACPSTKFCSASRIVNTCAPGYVCITQADSPIPNILNKAYPCPMGYYCGQGAQTPIMCPVGTFTNDTAAKQLSECTICQPGKYCDYESRIPLSCPQGAYCPMGSQAPTYCPKGTFQPTNNQSSIDNCLPCLGGYYCNVTGLGNLLAFGTKYVCPLGNYCPTGNSIKPIPCLAGTFIDAGAKDADPNAQSFSANSLNDCNYCPEHYYCKRGTTYRYEFPCQNGYLCPLGSGDQVACPAGYYCVRQNEKMVQILCNETYYCPMGSSYPKMCDPDQHCPAGSSSPSTGGMTAKDCVPGTYLNTNVCDPCLPGFVCDNHANQKYPIYASTEGGQECPPGYYCPRGSSSKTMKACPIGTWRLNTRGESLADCQQCPQGSASSHSASTTCLVCGAGSSNSEDFSTCACNGAFRSWQETTNSCVCLPGFQDPTSTIQTSSNTNNLDCIPILAPTCDKTTSFINEFNECVRQSSCSSYYKCPGSGTYSETLNNCFCTNVDSNPSNYCDANCQSKALKAFIMSNGTILLQAGSLSQTYPQIAFGDSVSLSGLQCQSICPISSIQTAADGTQQATAEALPIFVSIWKQTHPNYTSPYPAQRLLSSNITRQLQSGPQAIQESIQCIQPYDAVTWGVNNKHFPVYIKNSVYNTNPEFDYGAFVQLQTKMTSTALNIDTFGYTFVNEGIFVFGDYAAADQYQTIVLVTADKSRCQNQRQWPITVENMVKLQITPAVRPLKSYEAGLHAIPPLFVLLAFCVICCQSSIESRIEKRELMLRLKREGNSLDMAKYFKKAQDKFDKLEYLADLYKLIKENLEEINNQIAENDRRTEEENRDNMNKMLADKHSLLRELKQGQGDTNLEDIRTGLITMLQNLRFQDGRSLEELYKEQMSKEMLKVEQQKLDQIQDQDDSEDEEQSVQISEVVETKEHIETVVQDVFYEDIIKAKDQLKMKRDLFSKNIDKTISNEDRELILNRYDESVMKIEREMISQKEEQSAQLQARMKERELKRKQAEKLVSEQVAHQMGQLSDVFKQIEDLELEKDDITTTGINSKHFKKERENELRVRMQEVEKEKDSRLQQMRQEYMDRIKKAKDGSEKETILQEMGERLKSTEKALEEDKKRQEANLLKLLKARQKKNIKQAIKKIDDEVADLHGKAETLQIKIDQQKAFSFAQEGDGILSEQVIEKVAKVLDQVDTQFDGELDQTELDDLEVEKAQLEMLKMKELKAIDVQVEEELDAQARKRQQDRLDERAALQKQILQASDSDKQALMDKLKETDLSIARELEEEKRSQGIVLEERRRRKQDRMAIRKMRIELDQLEDVLQKELQMNNNKFKAQIDNMVDVTNAITTREIKPFLTSDSQNKEQALILIGQVNDELTAKIMAMLQSKQFFDLSKMLQCVQQQVATEQMIGLKEIHSRFDLLKENAIHELQGEKLNDELARLQAQRILECQICNEGVQRKVNEKESLMRQKQEVVFFKERKDIINRQNQLKRAQVVALMNKFGKDKLFNDIADKMVKRIDMTYEQQIALLEREKDEKVEKAKLRIIAENEEELLIMQENLNEAMQKEESVMNEQLDTRKQEIMRIKKQNLDDRLRMAQGEMSQDQIKLLKDQYEHEFETLDQAIRNEKSQQMQKMRQAMLQRRIDKERKRKDLEQEAEEKRRREAVHRMNAGMAKVFREFVLKKQQEMQNDLVQSKNAGKEQLKAKLHAWNSKVTFNQVQRGGEDIVVWNLTKKQDEIDKLEEAQVQPVQAFDVNELFVRILKVERMTEKVADFANPKQIKEIMTEVNLINQSIQNSNLGATKRQDSRQTVLSRQGTK